MGLPSGDGAFSQPHTRAHPDAHLEEPSSNAAQVGYDLHEHLCLFQDGM